MGDRYQTKMSESSLKYETRTKKSKFSRLWLSLTCRGGEQLSETSRSNTKISLPRISLEKFVRNRRILDEVEHQDVIVTKAELLWIMDNVHSNESIIRKLKMRLHVFEMQPEIEEQYHVNEKLKKEKQVVKDRCIQVTKEFRLQNDEIETLRKAYNETTQKASVYETLYQEQVEEMKRMRDQYETQLCEIELGHTRTLLQIGACTKDITDMHLRDKENFILE